MGREHSKLREFIMWNAKKLLLNLGGDKLLCIMKYYRGHRKFPNLNAPVTIGEKIQWIKLNYYNPLYVQCADKVQVRDYVRLKLGDAKADELFPRTYHIYDTPEDIRLSDLPEKFILKPNHSSGKFIICTDKDMLDEKQVRKTARKWMRENYYYFGAEWQYKEIVPKIICEELLENNIVDYRIFCFDGKPGFIRVTRHNKEADSGYTANFYDTEWKEMGCICKGDIKGNFSKPSNLEQMLCWAKKLSEDFFFVRVDLYEVGRKVYFAELTFTPTNGAMECIPDKFNKIFGDMINLPGKTK